MHIYIRYIHIYVYVYDIYMHTHIYLLLSGLACAYSLTNLRYVVVHMYLDICIFLYVYDRRVACSRALLCLLSRTSGTLLRTCIQTIYMHISIRIWYIYTYTYVSLALVPCFVYSNEPQVRGYAHVFRHIWIYQNVHLIHIDTQILRLLACLAVFTPTNLRYVVMRM